MQAQFVVVGDIHGSAHQLKVLLNLDLLQERVVVFLGDYVDVGLQSREVIDLLIRFGGSREHVRFLRGNHEVALLDYLHTGHFAEYAASGGIPTIRSYCGEVSGNVHSAMLASVPPAHREFLRQLSDFVETDSYLFSHAGYDPGHPMDRSQRSMVLTSHQELFEQPAVLPKVTVCGHYFQRSHAPIIRPHLVCLDTGCGMLNGPLTALLLPERQGVQVWPHLSVTSV
jgi:serine/threonine protein phosphatase 1